MKKSWGLLPKILSGEKTIESRWYQTKRTPWDKVRKGDTVFFKNAGEMINAKATVSRILQYELKTFHEVKAIIEMYGRRICLVYTNQKTWEPTPRYCILIFLANPKKVPPFAIQKKGFGISSAWLTVSNINTIKVV